MQPRTFLAVAMASAQAGLFCQALVITVGQEEAAQQRRQRRELLHPESRQTRTAMQEREAESSTQPQATAERVELERHLRKPLMVEGVP